MSSLRTLNINDVRIHNNTNYLNFSANKLEMIHCLAEKAGYNGLDQLQFYFPIIRFHSRWSELETWDFTHKVDGMKNVFIKNIFLTKISDVTDKYIISDAEMELPEDMSFFLEEFFDFLDNCGHDVLFVYSPQALGKDIETYKRLNRIAAIIQEHGYPYLNLKNAIDEMGIQTETDFYDNCHTNVHGAIKFTDYLAQYLIEHYGFTDKRGQPGWESWDESVTLYTEEIAPYSLPLEREHAPRDYELQAPVLNNVKVEDQTITLSWKESPNAEGYDIYRKSTAPDEKNWAYLTSIAGEMLEYIDSELLPETIYTYTVVPKKTTDGIEIYGNFNFNGVSGTTK